MSAWTKAPCSIKKCSCDHEAQDKLHGKGMRVHNPCSKGKDSNGVGYRCTVCGKTG